MALDGVPWAIGGDAEHGPNVARQLAYLATGGKQGVGGPLDLKVVPLDVPGAGVKVLSGVGSVLNRVAAKESYSIRNGETDADSVKIAATGSSGGRSDLVIARVDNPNVDSNAQDPADPVHGPYDQFDVIAGVPAGTRSLQELDQFKGLSAIELARIDLNASDGTVTDAKIVDLRTLATPRSDRQVVPGSLTDVRVTTSSGWQNFPANPIGGIAIPEWATHAVLDLQFAFRYFSGDAVAYFQAFLGTPLDASTLWGEQIIDTAQTDASRQPLVMPSQGYWPIPAALRGKTVPLTARIKRANTASGVLGTSASDYFRVDITFTERIS